MKDIVSNIILQKYKKRPINISPLKGGDVANVFKVTISTNKNLCIKFNKLYKDRKILKMEMATMKNLQTRGITTPIPLYHGITQFPNNIQYEYLIMSFEQGELLSTRWSTLSSTVKEEIITKLLKILDEVGKIKTYGYGQLNENLRGPHASFSDYIKWEIARFEGSGLNKMLAKHVWYRTKKILLQHSLSNKKPNFVHADFRLRNFIVSDEDLILFDFANALSMDRVFDFVRFVYTDFSEGIISSKDAGWIKKLYKEKHYKGENYQYDENIYKLLLTLRLSPWYYSMDKKERFNTSLEEMKRLSHALIG
jgi:aminoglycoside phosphotransferase (APT) family kinase protein